MVLSLWNKYEWNNFLDWQTDYNYYPIYIQRDHGKSKI